MTLLEKIAAIWAGVLVLIVIWAIVTAHVVGRRQRKWRERHRGYVEIGPHGRRRLP